MKRRVRLVFAISAACLIIHAPAFAQSPSAGLYCTSGLQPDGYIDFSDLPKAPNFSTNPLGQTANSAPITATLPVHGIAGLTVTVTIPALVPSESGPVYAADGGTLQLNGLPTSSYNQSVTVLALNFSQAIYGLGLNTLVYGRFDYGFTLLAGVTPDSSDFVTTVTGYTDYDGFETQSLQIVGLQTQFQGAAVQFNQKGEYYNITLDNLRVRSVATPKATIPRKGLQQWLRADTLPDAPSVWQDQSGNGHDATPVNFGPYLTADGRNCQAALQFINNAPPMEGIPGPGYFTFDLPIAGWDQMTIFLVAKAARRGPLGSPDGDDAVIFWAQDAPGGDTFLSPFQTHAYARFGTTEAGNTLSYARPGAGVGQDFTVTRAVHDGDTDSLYVDGVLATSQHAKLSRLGGTSGHGTIGKGANNTYFDGEVSEILVYNRVLEDNEAAQVERYLARKYGTE